MSDFKISLGFDIKDDSREKIQKLIDSINAENPKIKVDINTTDALKKVKELQKELKKLKDINIKINTKFNQSNNDSTKNNKNNTNTQLSTNANKVSWKKVDKNSNSNSGVNFDSSDFEKATDRAKETYDAYYKLLNIAKELKKHRITLEGLNVAKDSRQIDVVEAEITKLLISYTELKNAFKDDLSISQLNNIDKIFEETRFSVNKLKASMEDTSEFKEILFQFNMLKEKAKEIGSANTKLVNLDVSKNASEINFLTQRVNELNNEYYELFNTLRHKLSAEQLIELSNIFYKSEISVEHLNSKLTDTKNKIGSAIGEKIDTNYRKELDTIATSMTKLSNVSTNLKSDFANLQTIWQDMGTAEASGDIEKLIDLNNEYSKVLSKVKTELKESQNAQRINIDNTNLQFGKQKLSSEIDIWLKKNSAGAKEFGATLKNIQAQIQTADGLKLKNLTNQFKEVDRQAELAGKKGLAFGDAMKQQFERLTSYFTLYDVYSYTKRAFTSMFNEVKNVDTAMSGLYRVTDLTTSQYDEMYNGMTESAKKYGLVLSELIDGTTTWAKLGFDGQQASQLGEISARYQVVADTDAETAVTNLVTAYKAFQDELLNMYDGDSVKAVSYVSDVFNKIGNEFAIDAEQVGIGLTKGASALSVAGNTFQESVSMLTATSEVTGSPDRAGNMLKVISMRLRNATNELVEMGEEVDPAIKTVTELQAQILNLTHGKVNIIEDNGDFKSTYQILKEISEVYDQLSSIEQADLLEKIAGKQRASDVVALLRNFKQAEKVVESAYNAEGSAMEEYSIHMDTIQASLNTLSSTWQDFSNIFLNSKFLKGGIDTLSTLLDGFGKLVDTVGVLPTLLTGLSAIGTFKNKGFFKLIEDDATLSGMRMINIFSEVKDSLLALDSSLNTSFSFDTDFSNNLNNDIASLNNYINAVAQGESQGVAFSNWMLNASDSAKQYAQSMDASKLSVAQFELVQKQSEISLMASNKSMTSTKLLIDEYKNGLKNCGMEQEQFRSAIQSTNPQLANYLSGIKNTDASLNGYIWNLVKTKVATIGLQMATMLLNTAITMGLSYAITGVISKIRELYVSEEEARQKAEEELQTSEQQVQKYKEQSNSLDELINKYKELKNSGDNSPETRSEIVDIQRQIVGLVGKEAYNLDLVGGKLNDNLEKLKQYKKLLSEKESNSIFDKLEKTKDKNNKDRNTGKISTFDTGYDITGEIGYNDYRILEKANIKFNSKNLTNRFKVGLASDVNEFTKKEIKSTADALEYYKQVRKEWLKAYSEDKKISKSGAEYELGSNKLFMSLDKKIQELETKANEELQTSQDYLSQKLYELSEYDTELNNIKVKSADDYQEYINKISKKVLSDKNLNKLIKDGYFSKKDIKKFVKDYVSGLDEIGNYKNQWERKYNKIETNITFSQEGLDKAKSNFDTFYKSIEESMSDTGLTSDTINNIQALFGSLDGYDASKLFERTALGVKLNRTELEKLQRQYESQNKSAIHSNLRDLIMDYEDLQDKLDRCTDAKERENIQSQMESKEDEINEVKRLASEYDALTSAYYKWVKAQSTPNEGDAYDSFVSNLKNVKELYSKGLIGTDDFQTSVQLMTNEDLSGKTAEEIVKVYQDKLPTVKKFFKEGTSGCENFLKSVEALNKGWAKQNKDGSWEFNFDNEKLAKELGISVDLIELMLGKLKDLGFEVDLDYTLDDIDSLNKLAKDANKTLNELNKTDVKFNFDAKNTKDANAEIDKAQKLLDKFKNDDGTINLNIDGASEAQTVLTALIKNRQELNQPTIMEVKLNKDELETDYGKTVTLLQDLQSYSDKLEINLKTGRDTSATKKNIQNTIKEINKSIDKLSEKDKLKLNAKIDTDDLKGRLSTIDANIEAGVEVSDKDIELIRTAVGQVNPEINSKVKVDDSEVEDFKNKDKNTKSTHKVKVDKKEVDKFKKAKHTVRSVLEYGLVKTFELANFMIHPPKLKSVIEFTASGLNTIRTTIQNLFNGNSSNKDTKDKKGKKKDKKSGKSKVDGTAHINGSAFTNGTVKSGNAFVNGKRGDWSVGTSGKALVGELGEELLVRNGKYFTVGSDSAEFVDVQPNDIIFNHKQVQQLFKYGKIINGKSRGRALASGSAFVDGTIKSGMAFGEGTGKIITGGTTKKKTTTKSSSSSKSKSKTKTKTKSSSSSSSDAEKTKETFDWIEIAIERIENAISDLDKIASSVYYSFSTRNDKLRKEYSLVNKEISLQQKAYTRYMKEANSVGLSSKYKKLVQNGKIDISTITDDKLKEKITKYKEWYDKAQNVKDAIADLKLEMRNLRKELFDNISTEYDNYVGRLEKQSNLIQNYISRTESKGMSVSTKYYDALIKNENKSLSKLQAERKNLLNVLNTGLKKGDLALYSEAWYEMQGKIDDVTESIQMCTNNIIEFQNEIRQIKWDNFDYLHETISQITDESDFLISLFEDKKLFDDKGNITNIGTSTLGLHGMNYNVFMQQSQSYAREIESLNQEIAKTPNDKELISRRNDLIKSQQEMIQSAMSEKQAMIDLVRDGYDLQLDSLQDLIDKYNEALESQKDLYEYNKKVKDQTSEIAKLEKQLSAYQGDNSEETKSKLQELRVSLEEAKGNLQETEYQRYIQNQQDLLDNMYSEYEDFIDSKFENVDALFSDLISNVNSNSSTVNETISSESDKVGYTLSNSMETIWGNTGDVLSDFSNGFNEFSGKFDTYAQNGTTTIESWLSTINSNLVAMVNASNNTATNDVSKVTSTKYTATAKNTTKTNNNKTNTKSNNTKNTNKTPTSNKSKTAGYISSIQSLITSSSSSSIIKKVQTALKALGFKGKDKKALSVDGIWGANTDYAVKSFQKYSGYGGAITADGKIGKNTKAKFKKAGYKKGIYNLNKNELAWTQEDNKPEIIIRKSDGAILTPLSKGDSVLSNNATSNIWSMANDPTKFIKDNLNNNLDISNGNNNISNNTVQNDINMNITLPNVKNYNEFVNQLQKDSKFERMIQDMTVNQLSGKSSLSKFKYKFK